MNINRLISAYNNGGDLTWIFGANYGANYGANPAVIGVISL